MKETKLSRRTLLGGAAGICALGPLGIGRCLADEAASAPRRGLPNPYVENGKPVVAVVRGAEFSAMLAKGMEILGGFARYGSGNSVVLKPNFLTGAVYPITTEGASLIAVAEALRRENFTDITIADWGSSGMDYAEVPTGAFQFYKLPEKAGPGTFKIKDTRGEGVVTVEDPRWEAMTRVGAHRTVFDAGLIINMPTIKQHTSADFTCALKAFVGPIDTPTRKELHRDELDQSFTREQARRHLRLAIAEIASAFSPELTIIDARTVLGRMHHTLFGGIRKEAGRVIISGDTMAAERVAAQVLEECYEGFKVSLTDLMFSHASKLGLGVGSTSEIVVKEASV